MQYWFHNEHFCYSNNSFWSQVHESNSKPSLSSKYDNPNTLVGKFSDIKMKIIPSHSFPGKFYMKNPDAKLNVSKQS